MAKDMLPMLSDGLQKMHDDAERPEFLEEVWNQRQKLWTWQGAEFSGTFKNDSLPVFLHGGSSAGKVVVMGINPGWSSIYDPPIEKRIQSDAAKYVSFHEKFFDEYPKDVAGKGRGSPFWNNLRSKLAVLSSPQQIPLDKWKAYRSLIVAQDLIPFHSTSAATTAQDLAPGAPLGDLAAATLEGLGCSRATEVWVFSREGYEAVRQACGAGQLLKLKSSFATSGCTKKGRHRTVKAILATIDRSNGCGPLPVLAVDNALVSQPTFPFDEVYCSRASCSPQATFAEQLLKELLPYRALSGCP